MPVKKKLKGVAEVDLPREKLARKGIGKLSNEDLIALLLRSGVKEKNVMQLAQEILNTYTLEQLSNADIDSLVGISGMGKTRASSLLAAFELHKRLVKEKKNFKPVLDRPEKVYKYASDLINSNREKFIALYLDSRLKLIKRHHISVGTVSASLVHPRDVFKPAIENNASNIIVIHNHPSGECTPSDEDVNITGKLIEAGNIIGIPVMDHIIVAADSYYSFKENKKLEL
jgi:DNA repair protein RadC